MTKGDISILALLSMGIIVLGTVVLNIMTPKSQDTRSKAASSCTKIISLSTDPVPPLSPSQDFRCNVTLETGFENSTTITCGWSKNGLWPQTGGKWENAKCEGVNCTFGIKMDADISGSDTYELVGYDFSSSCNRPFDSSVSLKKPLATTASSNPTNTPRPDEPTTTPTPTPIGQEPTPTPTPGSCTPHDWARCTTVGGTCCENWGNPSSCGWDNGNAWVKCQENCQNPKEFCKDKGEIKPKTPTDPVACLNGGIPCKDSYEKVYKCGNEDLIKRFEKVCGTGYLSCYNRQGVVPCSFNPLIPFPEYTCQGVQKIKLTGCTTKSNPPPQNEEPTQIPSTKTPTLTPTATQIPPTLDTSRPICPNSTSWTASGAEIKYLPYKNDKDETIRPGGCIKPRYIVMHWSGQGPPQRTNSATYYTLIARGRSCQFGIDDKGIQQWQEMYTDRVERGICAGPVNNTALNIEIAGCNFDNISSLAKGCVPQGTNIYSPAQYKKVKQLVCELKRRYSLPISQIVGHYEVQEGKSDPGANFLRKRLIPDILSQCPD